MAGYLFGGNTGLSYNELQRRREIADALSKQIMGETPKTTAQGIGALMKGIGAGVGRYSANKGIKEGTDSANSAYDSIFGRLMGGAVATGVPSTSAASQSSSIPMTSAASEVAATSPSKIDISGSKQDFINSLLPAAIEEGKRTGVDPRIIVAQAAQETGWGKSAPGNNYFGIKSHGQSGGNSLMTTEYVNGQKVKVRDSFRGYNSPEDSVRGYGDFITQNPRYKAMREAQGLDNQLSELQASGYATDPNYSRSVGAIARSINLPNEVASLDANIGVPYQPSLTLPDPNAESRRQQAMQQIVGSQPSAADAVSAMGQGGTQSAYVDPAVNSPNAPKQAQPRKVAQNGQPPMPMQAPQAPQSPFQGVDPAMIQLLNNPFLDPDKKAIIQTVVQQQMQANEAARQEQQWRARQEYVTQQQRNDPAYKLDIDTKQAQLDAIRAKPQKQWQKLDDSTLFNPETGETQRVGAPAASDGKFRFEGKSVEAQALNGLMEAGQLTEAEAQQLAAGKQITDPATGALIFMTPQGVFGKSADGRVAPLSGNVQQAPAAPTSVDIFADVPQPQPNELPAAAPAAAVPSASAVQPQPTAAQPGMIPLTNGDGVDVKARQRQQMAKDYGLDPNSEEGKRFILTGTLPAADKGVTSGDRQAIREADDMVMQGEATLGLLGQAMDLSPKANQGFMSGTRSWLGANLPDQAFPDFLSSPESGKSTIEYDNIIKDQALGQLKSIFGAAPTEGERAILLEIQGSSSQPRDVRENILKRAQAAVERRVAFNRDRARDLRSGNYYKTDRNEPNVQTNAPQTPAEATGLPPVNGPAPNKRVRFNPATGEFE